jgi:hypothetical protein
MAPSLVLLRVAACFTCPRHHCRPCHIRRVDLEWDPDPDLEWDPDPDLLLGIHHRSAYLEGSRRVLIEDGDMRRGLIGQRRAGGAGHGPPPAAANGPSLSGGALRRDDFGLMNVDIDREDLSAFESPSSGRKHHTHMLA